MERYDLLYRLYEDFDTAAIRDLQTFVDVFPAVDSRVALDYWQDARAELDTRKAEVRDSFAVGETLVEIAATADRDHAFTSLDLHSKYGRAVNVLVLDVDETLRSAGGTDNEIPRETLHALTKFHEAGVPIVICTGQTLENVKGFLIQGLGNELVHSSDVSIVYETGTGVFTPGHGSQTKRLLYDELDEEMISVFDEVRSRVLPEAPDDVARGIHLQGNEFNVTLKPNFDVGSPEAERVIDRGLVYLVDLLGEAVAAETDEVTTRGSDWARAYFAAADPEIEQVFESEGASVDCAPDEVPEAVTAIFERVDVAYYHADAAEVGSLELNKPRGVQAALEVLGIDDPFLVVMGDSKSDLRVMEWAAENECGIAAAPEHSSAAVLDHVRSTDGLVFDRGGAAAMLRTIYVMNLLADL
ncbi:HAD hydrolase family protein [Salinigranum halophilum]|uniref:HAD hydrolase family protein n=1 Tax=Salinigranum halophilum TaxID=2565931 RepID=UPI0010A8986E|nr:HAD hydrolase family protein [Salinigranum halophilum]